MSRYSGRQGHGAARRTREFKRTQAAERQAECDAKPKPTIDDLFNEFVDEVALHPFGEFE